MVFSSSALAALFALVSAAPVTNRPVIIPTRFEADRVYVELTTAKGLPLELYTDSGFCCGLRLSSTAVARLNLTITKTKNSELSADFGPNVDVTTAPALAPAFPPLPELVVVMSPDQLAQGGLMRVSDGLIGTSWFQNHVWTWDYPAHRLTLESRRATLSPGPHVIPLAFQVDARGERSTNFARIDVKVDGQTLPMLLDTGATTRLTREAMTKIGDGGPEFRATSMIAANVFDRWRKEHPDWPYIADGQAVTHSVMIRVPSVEIAGYSVGPVWFTHRRDADFHDFMSSMMDSRIEGAIGGNVFRYFAMTVDYPAARAAFRCRLKCKVIQK